jgi:hypothetical protein
VSADTETFTLLLPEQFNTTCIFLGKSNVIEWELKLKWMEVSTDGVDTMWF